jgi:hypothetical protein
MTVNVKGRNIEIDDALAKEYESRYFEPVSEKLLLMYFAQADGNILNSISTYPIQKLDYLAEKYLDEDVSIWR